MSDGLAIAIARLDDAGVEAWDAPARAYLDDAVDADAATTFAARLAGRLDEAKAEARVALEDACAVGAIDVAACAAIETQIARGDVFDALVDVEAARLAMRTERPARKAWIASLRARAEARDVAVDDDALAAALLAEATSSASAATTLVRGRADDEDAGPYHPGALVRALLVEIGTLSPSLLAARLAFVDDVARVLAMTGAPLVERATGRPRPRR
jgi:hypothetical protein